ncbi:hypothetical protein FNF29_00249 [Cafeteria roenbergensis]|uniref:Uncharacterized protein n=1 Tax=Cafeteria roenbergensis TaxID=33653 RepID=A0A5A8CYT1_CAFRO|nr:hypothetical protein FNF29_00249 [Cafeteria roenbergensis]|eukprot:KAA0157674.1 hypothetical protein FNF29_00249 [Cafeteria roenbergensis]
MILPGEGIIVTEVWWVPTTFPSPASPRPGQWRTQLISPGGATNYRDDLTRWGVPAPAVSVNRDGSHSANAVGSTQVLLTVPPEEAAGGNGSSLRFPAAIFPVGVRSADDPPPQGTPKPPPAPRMDRPHQVLAMLVVNLTRLGMLRRPSGPGPDSFRGPQEAGTVRLPLPRGTGHEDEVGKLLVSASIVDGDGQRQLCPDSRKRDGSHSLDPSWVPPPSSSEPRTLRACFGGHNTTCDIEVRVCQAVATLRRPNVSTAEQRARLLPTVFGSPPPYGPTNGPPSAAWQVGHTGLAAFWKPCSACADASLPCDAASCMANVTRLIQSRTVSRNRVPPSAALGRLRSPVGLEWDGGVASSSSVLASMLMPMLSSASVSVALDVPVGQLRRASRQQFLLDLTAEAHAAAGGSHMGCLEVECEACPPAADGLVWANRSTDPSNGLPYVPSRASTAVRLRVRVRFLPAGKECSGGVPADREWLVDARPGQSREPVAFTGLGSNVSWEATHPSAAALKAELAAGDGQLSPMSAPVLRALSLASSLADLDSHRVAGMWLVWARPEAQPAPSVEWTPRCLSDALAAPVASSAVPSAAMASGNIWWLGSDCVPVTGQFEEVLATAAFLVPLIGAWATTSSVWTAYQRC